MYILLLSVHTYSNRMSTNIDGISGQPDHAFWTFVPHSYALAWPRSCVVIAMAMTTSQRHHVCGHASATWGFCQFFTMSSTRDFRLPLKFSFRSDVSIVCWSRKQVVFNKVHIQQNTTFTSYPISQFSNDQSKLFWWLTSMLGIISVCKFPKSDKILLFEISPHPSTKVCKHQCEGVDILTISIKSVECQCPVSDEATSDPPGHSKLI